jgi:aminoglycoside 6'-N-acetyltransferase
VIRFEPLREPDLPLVREWLGREHVRGWYGRDSIDESIRNYEEALAGRDPTDHYLITLGGKPIGMIQTYLVNDYPDWEAIVEVGPDVAGVDLFVGEEELTGQGLGPQILAQFAREVVFAREDTQACIATVEEANRRSWRAFEKAGFQYVLDVEEEGLPHRLMRLDRRYPP